MNTRLLSRSGCHWRRSLSVTTYTRTSPKLTAPITLALVTDLHSTLYGPGQEILLNAIHRQNPDLVLLSGDIADHKVPLKGALILLKELGASYPCFYVSGNHEEWTRQMPKLRSRFARLGVHPLRGNSVTLRLKGQAIQLGGVDDPHAFVRSHHSGRLSEKWVEQLKRCSRSLSPDCYSILLSHRPELTRYYAESGFNLVLCGHAHGGQIRLSFCPGGLLAPHQGFFPKYAGGMYELGGTSMVVSRGLCRNCLPRFGNPPELVMVRIAPPEKTHTSDRPPS